MRREVTIMNCGISRRRFLGTAAGAATGLLLNGPNLLLSRPLAAGRVAIGACPSYGPEVTSVLATMFDQLGGLEGLVRGETVAIKLNLTGTSDNRLHYA